VPAQNWKADIATSALPQIIDYNSRGRRVTVAEAPRTLLLQSMSPARQQSFHSGRRHLSDARANPKPQTPRSRYACHVYGLMTCLLPMFEALRLTASPPLLLPRTRPVMEPYGQWRRGRSAHLGSSCLYFSFFCILFKIRWNISCPIWKYSQPS
jgi:hypothetical protein